MSPQKYKWYPLPQQRFHRFCFLLQTITLEAILENSDSLTVLYAEHLQQQWWNLQHYDELLPIFTKIVNNPKPIKIKLSLGYQLQKMGLVRLKGNLASLYCELFRPFFMGALN